MFCLFSAMAYSTADLLTINYKMDQYFLSQELNHSETETCS